MLPRFPPIPDTSLLIKHLSDNARLTALWHDLSSEDRQWLRQKLLRQSAAGVWSDEGCLGGAELRAAETWFRDRAAAALTTREKTSRLRLWLSFMILRHAGLRWVEMEQLRRKDVDLVAQCLHIAGPHARDVPISPVVAAQMASVLDDPSGMGAALLPVTYDASHIRRTLQRCGQECAACAAAVVSNCGGRAFPILWWTPFLAVPGTAATSSAMIRATWPGCYATVSSATA